MHKLNKGLTIEYVLVMMAVVVAFVVAILLSVNISSAKAGQYNQYIQKKQVIDSIASDFIANKSSENKVDLSEKYGDNEFNYTWTESNNTLIVKSGQVVKLFVELKYVDKQWIVVCYRYGLL